MEKNTENGSRNRDILASKRRQIRGDFKAWRRKLTDNNVDTIGGEKDKLIGLLQERYGYISQQTEQDIERHLQEYARAAGGVASMSAKAREFGLTAVKKANESAPVIGENIKSLASVIREKTPHEGALGTAATKVAGGLESASCYLQEKKFDHLGEDFASLVRRYPLPSLLIGLGLGFLLVGRAKIDK
jgi:uncharacterized protein YjbJ (UPF0337 family)